MSKQSLAPKHHLRRASKRLSPKPLPSPEKFYELVVLIARRSEGDPTFNGFKLNKLLFYTDFMAYRELGQSITGQEYFRLPNGPAPRYRTPLWEQMLNRKDIAIRKDGKRETPLALREPDYDKFTKREIGLATAVIQRYWMKPGSFLRDSSHKFAGWVVAKEKETIPYAVALVGSRKPTSAEVMHGQTLATTAAACLSNHALRAS